MKIWKDKNNLLTIFNETIPQTKEYTYDVSWYTFSDFDKWMIVLHKKERKIINLKNLGDTMSIVYLQNTPAGKQGSTFNLPPSTFNSSFLKLFQWFDEGTNKKYYFIPGMGEAQQQEKNSILKKLWTNYSIEKTAKGMLVQGINETNEEEEENSISYLFWLILIYWKREIKNKELASIKIQIPLSGQHLIHQEKLDAMIKDLQNHGIFFKINKLANKNGIVYQMSTNDYELLEIWAKAYEPVEKFEKITKREFTDEMKTKLLEFLDTNKEIPQEGKEEVIKQIQEWTIKLLMK